MTQKPLPLLTVKKLNKSYTSLRAQKILQDISFTIWPGQKVAIVGPSAAGKTTLLHCLAGIQDYQGQVKYLHPHQVQGALVFQEPLLLQWKTVYQNVILPLQIKGQDLKGHQQRIQNLLEQIGLSGFQNHYPYELSGGMKRLVALARSLVQQIPLLLLDEPFAALDEVSRERLNDQLLELLQTHKQSMLLITHSIQEAVFLADRILVFTPSPAKIFQEIQVKKTYDLRDKSWREDPDYFQKIKQVRSTLNLAMHDWLTAQIMPGEGRGRQLGFPTINLDIEKLPFDFGVFAAQVRIAGFLQESPAVVHYGPKSTFGGKENWVEVHIIDQNIAQIPQKNLEIRFNKFIRSTVKFPNQQKLIDQMVIDCQTAREIFSETS